MNSLNSVCNNELNKTIAPSIEIVRIEIAKLELKSGDILCFSFPEGYSLKNIERFRQDILHSDIVPDGVGGLFLTDGVQVSVILT